MAAASSPYDKQPTFTPISEISPYSPFTLRAIVTKKFVGEGKKVKYGRIIIQDDSGEIQCNAFNDCIDKIENVEENQQYIIKGGKVKPKNAQYNHTKSEYEILFNSSTTITPTGQTAETKVFYNFSNLKHINDRTSQFADLIAVIQELEPVTSVTLKSSETTSKRLIKVCDDSNFSLEVTLWGQTAVDFSGQIGDVVAIKGCSIKEFQGKTQVSPTRSSIITINPDDPRTQVLKDWYAQHSEDQFEESIAADQKSESQIKTIYFSLVPDRHYGENTQKFDYFHIYCYPKFISQSKPLYYLGCPNPECHGKKLNDQLFCTKCEHQIDEPLPRFMFNCSLADFSGSMFVSVLGTEEVGETILGLSSQQVMQMKNENPEKFEEVMNSYLVHNVYFKDLYVTIKMKTDEYDGNLRKRASIVNAYIPDYVKGAKFFFNEIQKYSQH